MTESDIELLRLAAKAVGPEVEFSPEDTGFEFVCFDGPERESWAFWNPLEDDGDALRLAVKLRLAVFPPEHDSGDFAIASIPDGVLDDTEGDTWVQESVKAGESYAATRRAIVRAAAEIGKCT